MVDKLNTYMMSGVCEYWVVDPKSSHILMYYFTDNQIEGYQVCTKQDSLKSFYLKALSVDVTEIFDLS